MERKREKCKGMEGLIKESKDILKTDVDARDAGIIAVAQRVEHYEIARYGCARIYASLLGRSDWAELLEQTLNEEKEAEFWQWTKRPDIQAKLYPHRDPDQERRDVDRLLSERMLGIRPASQPDSPLDPACLI